MNKVITGIFATLGAVTLLSGTAYFMERASAKNYNKYCREEYIAKTYPNAEIVEINNESNSWFGGYSAANCLCYDKVEDIYFTQYFHVEHNGRYAPYDDGANNYQNAVTAKKNVQRCMDKAAEVLADNCEYKTVRDSFSHNGFLVFIKDPEIWQEKELYSALNDLTNDIFRREGGEYIDYQIVICGSEAYEKLTGLEIFNGKADKRSGYYTNAFSGFDIADRTDIKVENFDFNRGGDNQRLFKDHQQAYSGVYNDIILWIDGEPNKAPRDMQYDYFGLKY